ncbi:hypothetical protein BDA96_03G048900 [Sorghum bicolor]|uniref:Uncharacterized protein n=2 Tax=Sorghum bicolor TaxID=4558 RepID=A0A921R9A7_SORBI|nr:hypothetical protein BDA96_03G048900 [Sorghum bicolor]OQU86213.1 hypothetical protein SORBI_3003G045551 [Sorghum bicolor]
MIVHLKPLKGNLNIAGISLSLHLALKTKLFDCHDSHSLEVLSKKMGNRTNSNFGRSKLLRSGSNQSEAFSIASCKNRPAQVKRKWTPIKKKLGLPKKKRRRHSEGAT